jgi:hypothetical protein
MSEVICTECNQDLNNCVCQDCGCKACSVDNCKCQADHADRALEGIVERASTPNLGTLMRAGKKSGWITPVPNYGG